MAARRFSRRIDLRVVNVLLYGLLGLCAVLWWPELRWASRELPRYLAGKISGPTERSLYREAMHLIQDGKDLERARRLLERSIAIDPNSDAVYWLGEYFLAAGEPERALESFRRFIDFDPTRVEAYLHAGRILREQGRDDQARELLRRGLEYFERRVETDRPRLDPQVAVKFNRKAMDLYEYQRTSIERLRAALES